MPFRRIPPVWVYERAITTPTPSLGPVGTDDHAQPAVELTGLLAPAPTFIAHGHLRDQRRWLWAILGDVWVPHSRPDVHNSGGMGVQAVPRVRGAQPIDGPDRHIIPAPTPIAAPSTHPAKTSVAQ